MFDTSLVRPRAVAAPRRVALLSASIAIHSAVAFAIVVTTVASVEFPEGAPRQMDVFRPVAGVSLPPPLGDGIPPKKAAAPENVPPPVRKEPAPQEVTAPAEVPDETVPLEAPGTAPSDPSSIAAGGGEEGPGGTGGSPLGQPGGVGDDPTGDPFGTGGGSTIHIPGGEVRSARVVRRVEPRYPQSMITARIRSAVVTVRCIVHRNGRVRDPEIITSSFPPFNSAVLDAVRQWTFAPGTLRGEPVETWFELTVRFEVR